MLSVVSVGSLGRAMARGRLAATSSMVRTASLSTSTAWRSTAASTSKADRFVSPVDAAHLPRGFVVSATYAGVKAAISPKLTAPGAATKTQSNPKPDLALVVSAKKEPAAAAATFTKNVFKAAPVIHSSKALLKGQASAQGARAKAIITNSGCANAVTGEAGLRDTIECAKIVSALLGPSSGSTQGQPSSEALAAANADHTLVLSTGVIGVPLPMPTIRKALPHLTAANILSNSPEAWHEVARAFMTTDTFPKLRARSFELAGRKCGIVGIDKGAGMIHPNMAGPGTASGGLHATLLGLVATDAPISPSALQSALEHAVSRSFNCISVDGDMSTNDTIIALANGQAPSSGVGSSALKAGEEISAETHPEEYAKFRDVLTDFCTELSHLVVRDGEGAEKFVEITVKNAPTYEHAHAIASSISTSALVKCALHGGDANWGRILCAVGYTKLPAATPEGHTATRRWQIDPALVTVRFLPPTSAPSSSTFKPLLVLDNGVPQKVDEDEAGALLALEDIVIEVDLKGGSAGQSGARESATYWTCDFSKEYVAINGDYRS